MAVKPTCILLCGGKGTRMNSETKHKVCFEIGGRPAIHRTIEGLASAGADRFCVVLGSMAGQVMECVGREYPDALFVLQREPLGTGDAARTAVRALATHGVPGPYLIVMGDKIVDPTVIRTMIDRFEADGADAVFAVQPRDLNPSGGRVVFSSDGSLAGIVEARDVEVAAQGGAEVRLGAQRFPPSGVEGSRYVNAALYLFADAALRTMIRRIDSDNAQHELYLTDVVNLLISEPNPDGEAWRVSTVVVEEPTHVMAFNTVEELLEIEQVFTTRGAADGGSRGLERPVGNWLRMFENMPASLRGYLERIYGDDSAYLEDRRRAYLAALAGFAERFGPDRSVVLTRAPGRANLMGRHVEHRGGFVNVVSINKEIICVASAREDDRFRLSNVDSDFGDQEFLMGDYLSMLKWQQWIDYLDAKETQRLVLEAKGNWANYVKAAVLRLQYTYRDRKLQGMDMVFHGDIPIAAGLSSSSAVVVATAEAAIALNGLDVTPQEFVDLCGEGEWFVGSRGGAGDHAAMKLGEKGTISQIGFFPFGLRRTVPFPDSCRLVVANSFVRANKSTNAKDTFNQRIAEYEFSLALFKLAHPRFTERISRLRDVNPAHLGVTQSELLGMTRAVDEHLSPYALRGKLGPDRASWVETILHSHAAPERYQLRPVFLYGIAECERSRVAGDYLAAGDLDAFGRLMDVSHDGDRVVRWRDGESARFAWRATDAVIDGLVADLRSEEPDRVGRAQLVRLPGGYACSTEETDLLVDLSRSVPGVVGAQLSGAGLGGCVMVLVRNDSVEPLCDALQDGYYRPRGLENGVTVCTPVKGAMVLDPLCP
jgi:N-acetylgalactosamine kinase